MRQVYLDNNATTALDAAVLEAMKPYFSESFGNPASIHAHGQKARSAVEDARRQVADLIGAQPKEIVFTSGGTESDNTAIRGIVTALRSRGDHIITTTIEHSAVLRTCEQLEREGFRVTCVPVDGEGIIRLDRLMEAIEEKTILISVIHGNNEIGVIQPVHEIVQIAREHDILVHTDAVQSVGKIALNAADLGVDLLSLSGHKFHGPKGIGALYVRTGVPFSPLLLGGSHERNRRAGTLNVPGIVGLGKACDLALASLEDMNTRIKSLRDKLERRVLEKISDTIVNGSTSRRLPHVTNISFRSIEGEALLIGLDFQGIQVSTGSACASGTIEPSHVLTALGGPKDLRDSAIRFSLGRMTTEEEIDYVLDALPALIGRMREVSPLYRST